MPRKDRRREKEGEGRQVRVEGGGRRGGRTAPLKRGSGPAPQPRPRLRVLPEPPPPEQANDPYTGVWVRSEKGEKGLPESSQRTVRTRAAGHRHPRLFGGEAKLSR